MEWNDAVRILFEIDQGVGWDDELEALQRRFHEAAFRYGRMCAESALAGAENRAAMASSDRALALETLGDAVDALRREMQARGRDVTWCDALGDGRFELSDLGCYCGAILGLAGAHPSRMWPG